MKISRADMVVVVYSSLPMLSPPLRCLNRKLYIFWSSLSRKHIALIWSIYDCLYIVDAWLLFLVSYFLQRMLSPPASFMFSYMFSKRNLKAYLGSVLPCIIGIKPRMTWYSLTNFFSLMSRPAVIFFFSRMIRSESKMLDLVGWSSFTFNTDCRPRVHCPQMIP